MSAYKIITDSGSDLTEQMLEELKVAKVSLSVLFRGESRPDSVDEGIRSFYDALRAGEISTTSAVNPDGWASAIEPVLQAGQDALVMAFSSGLSTTYQSAVIAAEAMREEFPEAKICAIDSKAASLGQGLYVYLCAQQKLAGKTFDEVVAYAEEIKLNICHWFTVDDLNHLKRGGRVSATTALVGTMLAIKPVLHVDNEGHLINVSKARGRKASLMALVDQMEKNAIDPQNQTIFISHGDCEDDVQIVIDEIRKRFGTETFHINYVGPVIGSHTGAGVVALFFVGKER